MTKKQMGEMDIKFWDSVKGLYIDDSYFLVGADMEVYFDTDYGVEPTKLVPHFYLDGERVA